MTHIDSTLIIHTFPAINHFFVNFLKRLLNESSPLTTLGSLARLVSLLVIIMADVGSSALLELSYTYNLDAPTSPKLTPFTYKVLKKGYNDFGVW